MTQPSPVPLAVLVGRRVRAERERQVLTQDALANRLREGGLDWTRSMLAKAERGERGIDLAAFLCLALALRVPLVELVGDGGTWIALSATAAATNDFLGELFRGERPPAWEITTPRLRVEREASRAQSQQFRELSQRIAPGLEFEELRAAQDDADSEFTQKVAGKLGIPPTAAALLARRLWKTSLVERRDQLLTEPGLSSRAAQAKRGWITRTLIEELRTNLPKEAQK